jgi:hypothetical protein
MYKPTRLVFFSLNGLVGSPPGLFVRPSYGPRGVVKDASHYMSSILNEKKGKLFSIRMGLASSLDETKHSAPSRDPLKNNLIGQRFKFIQDYIENR